MTRKPVILRDPLGFVKMVIQFEHDPDLEAKRTARNLARRERDQIRHDCGLVRGRDSLGRVIWE